MRNPLIIILALAATCQASSYHPIDVRTIKNHEYIIVGKSEYGYGIAIVHSESCDNAAHKPTIITNEVPCSRPHSDVQLPYWPPGFSITNRYPIITGPYIVTNSSIFTNVIGYGTSHFYNLLVGEDAMNYLESKIEKEP